MSSWNVEIIGTSKWITNKKGNFILNVDNFSDKVISNIIRKHDEGCSIARQEGYDDMREIYREVLAEQKK